MISETLKLKATLYAPPLFGPLICCYPSFIVTDHLSEVCVGLLGSRGTSDQALGISYFALFICICNH